MTDWFVGPIMRKIINACSDYLQDQYRWQTGMKEELERLRESHHKVQAFVSASTQAQIRDQNSALNSWIWQLRDAIDEADDVLDDFEYKKLQEETWQTVRSTMSFLKKVGNRVVKMDSNLKRLEAVVKKLDNLSSEFSNVLHLLKNAKKKKPLRKKGLEKDVCLKLVNTHAFAGVENIGAHKKLTDIASSIVKKLSGSPLVAKAVGGLLNSNLNKSFWMNSLNSTDVLNVELEPGLNNILPILRLSCAFLPQPLQNCFAFCGIVPQDHMFDKDDLDCFWFHSGIF